MATRKFHLSEEAIDELKRAEKATRKSSELRRMQAVRLYGSGQTVSRLKRMRSGLVTMRVRGVFWKSMDRMSAGMTKSPDG